MYQIDFNKPIRIHFIGIGGISMSGLAHILNDRGFHITGSDNNHSDITAELENMGIEVMYGQRPENVPAEVDLIVYTAAIHPDNPEFAECVRRGIPMMDRAELLGQIMRNYDNSIAVAGTHGKTTTTSMVSHILLKAGMDPTISVGGILKSIGGNIRVGQSHNFITEACEYTNSFLKFDPRIAMILNVEEDHMDFFKDIDDIRASFRKFARKPGKNGLLVINGAIKDLSYFTDGLECKVLTYGFDPEFDYSASNVVFDEFARPTFDLKEHDTTVPGIRLSVTGMHNVSNALASIAVARFLGIDMDTIRQGLLNFTGTDRRFEIKGETDGITIIDDYAHHPTEIKATLTAAHDFPHRKIWCAFQPHTYTRTKAFLHEFAEALSLADEVVLTDIYAAREKDTGDIHSRDIEKLLIEKGTDARYCASFNEAEEYLKNNCKKGDLLITMGAGNIYIIGEDLLKK